MPRARRPRSIALCGVAFAAIAMSAACGDSSKPSEGTPTDPELIPVLQTFKDSTFKAEYSLPGTADDPSAGGTLVLYKAGADKFRFDISSADGTSIFIQTPDISVDCFTDTTASMDFGGNSCFKVDPQDPTNPVGSLIQSFSDLAPTDVSLLSKDTKTVAGQDTNCYRTKDNVAGDISTHCFTADGALLYATTEGDATSTIEATSVTTSVSDADFTPPYPVTDAPTDSTP